MPILATDASRALHSMYHNMSPLNATLLRFIAFGNRSSPPTHALRSTVFLTQRKRFSEQTVQTAVYGKSKLPVERGVHNISALIPSKLTEHDYIDLSGKGIVNIASENILRANGKPVTQPLHYAGQLLWPESSGGFLYLKSPREDLPPTTASLRFRVTNRPDPTSFAQGKDLMLGGLPWELPLIYSRLHLIRGILGEGGLSENLDKRLRRLNGMVRKKCQDRMNIWNDPSTPIISSQSQPFWFNFARIRCRVWLLGKSPKVSDIDGLYQFWSPQPSVVLSEEEEKRVARPYEFRSHYYPLYKGDCVARFEWLESSPESDSKRLAIRVLKINNPVVPSLPSIDMDLPEIKEGSYVPVVHPLNRTIVDSWGLFPSKHPQHYLATLPNLAVDLDSASTSTTDGSGDKNSEDVQA